MTRLAVIGSGMMGSALVRGLLATGWSPGDVVMSDAVAERLDFVREELGVRVTTDNRDAVAGAESVLLAVKPGDCEAALRALDGSVSPATTMCSIAAGVSTASLESWLGGDPPVVRAMPNTPARVGRGVTVLTPGRYASPAARERAEKIFSAVGPVVWLDEKHLDAVTAVSGSGPAYVFLLAEAMVDGGVAVGLPRDVAEKLAYATIEGAGRMLTELGEHPAVLRAQVTSPGGTTAAALSVLEAMSVRAAVAEAIRAAHRRSRELG